MRNLVLGTAAMLGTVALHAQKTYSFTSIPGDPLQARIYTLDNGLQVWLSRNTDAPRIQTNIAVRAGSKNDPSDATGLAHYLEHMLFKGTSHIGTRDWASESAVLKQISDAYEERRKTTDPAERDRIYRRIDSLSTVAASFTVPNEYDKMIKSLGARGTNAYTSTERTVYINDIPSDELERWMAIESERMHECVLRLFHTELETVYEEFNRSQDNDGRAAYKKLNELLYPHHPYGTQTTLGTGEHLKNPSMVKIHAFFDTYYVPNNMAVILAGDIDFDRTIAMVDKYFGGWEKGYVPEFTFEKESPLSAPVVAEVSGPESEWVDLAWRFNGYHSDDPIMLQLIAGLLSNGRAGLIDLDLLQTQRVLNAGVYAGISGDYSSLQVNGEPKEGQTLEQVRDLLLGEMAALRAGSFDDWLIEAVVNDFRQRRMRTWGENNRSSASAMTDAFILKKRWSEEVDLYDRMARITKAEVVAFANAKLNDNYVCVFKRNGPKTAVYQVEKPRITAIDIKREGKSAWRAEWDRMPAATMEPEFVDYATAIQRTPLKNGLELASVVNPTNDLFSLRYIVDMGTKHDRELEVATNLLEYLGTSKLSPADLKKELFKLGLSLNATTTEDRCYVTLSGLEKNLAAGVDLLEKLLADAQPNEEALKGLVADIRKSRQDRMKEKSAVLYQGLASMARYGATSPFNDVLSDAQLNALTSKALVDRIKGLTSHEHRVVYYGKMDPKALATLLNAKHRVPAKWKPIPAARPYVEQPTTSNSVLFVDHDMVQTEMLLMSKAGPFDLEKVPYASLFNEYFGSGLSSIVFQEIREAKALAYGANASYSTPQNKDEAHYVRAFIGTQADKLNDAVAAMLVLMNEMPEAETQFEGAKGSALKVIASTRVTKENIYWSWDAAQRRGLDHDMRQFNYEHIPAIDMAAMKAFFDKEVKGRNYTFLIIGKKSAMDLSVLEKLGPVREVSKSELFGYEEVK
ncbi:MAG TPA: insulinase family protein [Flavobacteriales bacterium]|nr:insulinase family protein [Flavobacteriales bacterium]HNU55822.1 insulinase family protein [Flavobacteriales bacterium]